MFLNTVDINTQSSPAEIVKGDYRTAEVFQRFGIQFCCGARLPLEKVCSMNGYDLSTLVEELRKTTRIIQLPSNLPFDKWSVDFLIDYIINIHHYYVRETFPALGRELNHFAQEHRTKYPIYSELCNEFEKMANQIVPHIQHEEESIFPYLRRVAHAYYGKDSYARLLVKTMRKPLARMMDDEHEIMIETIYKFRNWTNNYNHPANACTSHGVILSRLEELDHDFTQHVHLENNVLFPKILKMEKELLESR